MAEEEKKYYSKEEVDDVVQHTITRRDIKEIKDSLTGVKDNINTLFAKIDNHYVPRGEIEAMKQAMIEQIAGKVTKNEFAPVRNIVYGMVSLILIAVVGGLLSLVVMNGKV